MVAHHHAVFAITTATPQQPGLAGVHHHRSTPVLGTNTPEP